MKRDRDQHLGDFGLNIDYFNYSTCVKNYLLFGESLLL